MRVKFTAQKTKVFRFPNQINLGEREERDLLIIRLARLEEIVVDQFFEEEGKTANCRDTEDTIFGVLKSNLCYSGSCNSSESWES